MGLGMAGNLDVSVNPMKKPGPGEVIPLLRQKILEVKACLPVSRRCDLGLKPPHLVGEKLDIPSARKAGNPEEVGE